MKRKILILLVLASTLYSGSALASLTQTEVSQLYVSIIGRTSEGSGNTYWQSDPSSTSMTVTASVMLNTEAAMAYFGPTLDDNEDFIEHIYLNTLDKTYAEDPDGIDYWVSELDGGKTKGEVIASLIVAAQDPVNAGAAQDRFNNKVAVSDYCADRIIDFTDIETFKGFIEYVTSENSTIDRAFESVLEQAGNVPHVRYLGSIFNDPYTGYSDIGVIPYEQAGVYAQQTENGGYTVHTEKRLTDVQTDSDGIVISSTDVPNFSIWQEKWTGINSILRANDGGYILAGSKMQYEQPVPDQPFDYYVYPNGIPRGYEAYLLKTDANGVEDWSNVFPFRTGNEASSSVYSQVQSVYPALDGGYILEVYVGDKYPRDLYLVKVDGNGSEVWSKKYDYSEADDTIIDLVQAHDGGYIILGESKTSNEYTFPTNFFLIQIDSFGNELWNESYGHEQEVSGVKVKKTTDRGYLLQGSNYNEGLLIKIDTSGNEVWRQTYPASYNVDIEETVDGDYVISSGKALIKIDSLGEVVWQKSYVGEFSYSIGSITQTSDGGFILFGGTGGNQTGPAIYIGYDIWLIKIDSSGNEIWSREFDLGGNEWPGGSVFQTSEGGFVLIGRTEVHGEVNRPYLPESIYFIKVDRDGYVIE